jgi:shikimate dehydrogenase
MRSIGCETQICAVIGNPAGHSLSPAIHSAAYEALDLDFIYVAFPVEDVKGALAGMRALGNFRGMSVTIPHKIEVMKHVHEIAEEDRSIGSINTVIHDGDKLIGLGTDLTRLSKRLSADRVSDFLLPADRPESGGQLGFASGLGEMRKPGVKFVYSL